MLAIALALLGCQTAHIPPTPQADVELPELAPRAQRGPGKLSAAPSAGDASVGESNVFGALDSEDVEPVVHGNLRRFHTCYERGLLLDPSMRGDVEVRFVIGSDGEVEEARVFTTTLRSPPVEDCLVEKFQRLTFKRPLGASGTIVVSELSFHVATNSSSSSAGRTWTIRARDRS